MISERDLKKILFEGLKIVKQAISGEITARDFLERYHNFYYYNALDGHEADEYSKQLFEEYSEIIHLHEQIQNRVVDCVYVGNNIHLYRERISVDQVIERLKKITATYQLDALLSELDESPII